MQNQQSLISVSLIIANYNYGRYLEECYESVLNQTFKPDEIIVIDDYSTDNSDEILEKISQNENVRVIKNKENLGIVKNFNKAVSLTNFEHIVFVGADNRIKRDFLEKYILSAEKFPNAAIYYSDIEIFGPRSSNLAKSTGAVKQADDTFLWKFPEPKEETLKNLETTNFMHGSSMFKRSWHEKVGGYKDNGIPEDFDLFRRIVWAGGEPVHVPFATLEYRQHSVDQANTKLTLESENNSLRERILVLESEVKRQDLICKSEIKPF